MCNVVNAYMNTNETNVYGDLQFYARILNQSRIVARKVIEQDDKIINAYELQFFDIELVLFLIVNKYKNECFYKLYMVI